MFPDAQWAEILGHFERVDFRTRSAAAASNKINQDIAEATGLANKLRLRHEAIVEDAAERSRLETLTNEVQDGCVEPSCLFRNGNDLGAAASESVAAKTFEGIQGQDSSKTHWEYFLVSSSHGIVF